LLFYDFATNFFESEQIKNIKCVNKYKVLLILFTLSYAGRIIIRVAQNRLWDKND